jgi:hypothetical protein
MFGLPAPEDVFKPQVQGRRALIPTQTTAKSLAALFALTGNHSAFPVFNALTVRQRPALRRRAKRAYRRGPLGRAV